jgi:hypothetical protein
MASYQHNNIQPQQWGFIISRTLGEHNGSTKGTKKEVTKEGTNAPKEGSKGQR